MAGMLYLPRLFVYHSAAEVGSKQSETFKVMERRLLKVIINPAMIITWLAGIYLAWAGHWYTSGWLGTIADDALKIVMRGANKEDKVAWMPSQCLTRGLTLRDRYLIRTATQAKLRQRLRSLYFGRH
jgi:hypothetical protein